MSNFILTGLFTEGTTDIRFLRAVVKNTLDDIAFECTGDIETELEIIEIDKKGLSFVEQIYRSSLAANNLGALILFVHTDADAENDTAAFLNKINPATEFIESQEEDLCRNIVAIVPVYMTEAWMLADKVLLKNEIGVEESDNDLEINKGAEEFADPKSAIENVIRISKENQTKRKRNKGLDISELYQIIGQKIEISELEKLPSYLKFKNSLRDTLKSLNFLHE